MSQQALIGNLPFLRGGENVGVIRGAVLPTALLLSPILLMIAIAAVVNSYKWPYPTGWVCEGQPGVVINRTAGRKNLGPYHLDGQKVSRLIYRGCVKVSLPHN